MAIRYEYYITGEDAEAQIMWSAATWGAQTFTPSIAHKIISVKLKLQRHGTPGNLTVSIRNTTFGEPSGGDLCSGTTNGNTLTDAEGGEWREITLGDGYDLEAGTQYAIVCRGPGFNITNFVGLRGDSTSPTYPGGKALYSIDSGGDWTNMTWDLMFEEYGPDEPAGGGGGPANLVAAGII